MPDPQRPLSPRQPTAHRDRQPAPARIPPAALAPAAALAWEELKRWARRQTSPRYRPPAKPALALADNWCSWSRCVPLIRAPCVSRGRALRACDRGGGFIAANRGLLADARRTAIPVAGAPGFDSRRVTLDIASRRQGQAGAALTYVNTASSAAGVAEQFDVQPWTKAESAGLTALDEPTALLAKLLHTDPLRHEQHALRFIRREPIEQ